MKKIIIGFVSAIALTSFIAAKVAVYEVKKSTGEVEQYEGVMIFTDCKPASQYDYLGSCETPFFGSTVYQDVRTKIIKIAKEKFPNSEAIILSFKSNGVGKCDCIKFK